MRIALNSSHSGGGRKQRLAGAIRDSRQDAGAQNATINRELAALKRMFSLGAKATPPKVLRMPAFPHLREDNVRQGFLEDGQNTRLV